MSSRKRCLRLNLTMDKTSKIMKDLPRLNCDSDSSFDTELESKNNKLETFSDPNFLTETVVAVDSLREAERVSLTSSLCESDKDKVWSLPRKPPGKEVTVNLSFESDCSNYSAVSYNVTSDSNDNFWIENNFPGSSSYVNMEQVCPDVPEEISEGFDRLKELVSELLAVDGTKIKIEENGQFVQGLLKQLSLNSESNTIEKIEVMTKEKTKDKELSSKKKNREDGVTVADQEDNILGEGEVVDYEGDSAKSNKNRKDKGLKSFSRKSKSVKEKQGINSQIDKLLTENNIPETPSSTLIQDIYCPPEPAIITGQLYNVVMYILNKDIPINNVNTVWTKNCQPNKETRDYLLKVHNVLFSFFTDEEDEKILTRFRYLIDNQIITKPKQFLKQLNDQNGMNVRDQTKDKASRNIVGLYVGQDLPNRIAHNVTQRLVFLLTGSSLFNNYQTKSPVKTANIPEGPGHKTKQKLRYWTVDEDKILIEAVLKDKRGRGFIPVEELVDRDVNWEEVAEYFAEFGRTRQLVRERWSRTVKNMLLEGEQDIQERYDYRKSLLEYVIKLGVKDKKEIRWKEVAKVFAPKTSAVLSQDFWNLIRQKKNDTLAGKLENALKSLERPTGKSLHVNNKKNEARSQLLDFYCILSMRS